MEKAYTYVSSVEVTASKCTYGEHADYQSLFGAQRTRDNDVVGYRVVRDYPSSINPNSHHVEVDFMEAEEFERTHRKNGALRFSDILPYLMKGRTARQTGWENIRLRWYPDMREMRLFVPGSVSANKGLTWVDMWEDMARECWILD